MFKPFRRLVLTRFNYNPGASFISNYEFPAAQAFECGRNISLYRFSERQVLKGNGILLLVNGLLEVVFKESMHKKMLKGKHCMYGHIHPHIKTPNPLVYIVTMFIKCT